MASSFPLPSLVELSSSISLELTPRSIGVDLYDLREYWAQTASSNSTKPSPGEEIDERLFKPCTIGVFGTAADLLPDEQARCRTLTWHHTTIAALLKEALAEDVPLRGDRLGNIVTGQHLTQCLEEKDAVVYVASWNYKTFRAYQVKMTPASQCVEEESLAASSLAAASSPAESTTLASPERRTKKGQEKIVEAVAFDFVSNVMAQVLGESSAVELYERIGLAAASDDLAAPK